MFVVVGVVHLRALVLVKLAIQLPTEDLVDWTTTTSGAMVVDGHAWNDERDECERNAKGIVVGFRVVVVVDASILAFDFAFVDFAVQLVPF